MTDKPGFWQLQMQDRTIDLLLKNHFRSNVVNKDKSEECTK